MLSLVVDLRDFLLNVAHEPLEIQLFPGTAQDDVHQELGGAQCNGLTLQVKYMQQQLISCAYTFLIVIRLGSQLHERLVLRPQYTGYIGRNRTMQQLDPAVASKSNLPVVHTSVYLSLSCEPDRNCMRGLWNARVHPSARMQQAAIIR